MSEDAHPVAARIRSTLSAALAPSKLEVVDESYKHAKHAHVVARAGSAGDAGETHFLVRIVSSSFDGKSLIERHRMVNGLLAGEMRPDGVHALAIEARAPGE